MIRERDSGCAREYSSIRSRGRDAGITGSRIKLMIGICVTLEAEDGSITGYRRRAATNFPLHN